MAKQNISFRKHFDYDVEKASDESAQQTVGESLTVQSQTEDADINVMMKRYGITGKMPENIRLPEYGDFDDVGDYQSALHRVMEMDDEFMRIPADVREKFANNPGRWADWVLDPKNEAEAIKLGFKKAKPVSEADLQAAAASAAKPAAQPVAPAAPNGEK